MCESLILLGSQGTIFATQLPSDLDFERFRGAKDASAVLGHDKRVVTVKAGTIDASRLQ